MGGARNPLSRATYREYRLSAWVSGYPLRMEDADNAPKWASATV